jgi:hypothetical protein
VVSQSQQTGGPQQEPGPGPTAIELSVRRMGRRADFSPLQRATTRNSLILSSRRLVECRSGLKSALLNSMAVVPGPVQPRGHQRLKNGVRPAVAKARPVGPEDLRAAAQPLEAQGSHVEFGLAKRWVRLAKYWAATGTLYRPQALLDPDTPKEKRVRDDHTAWDKRVQKWKGQADWKPVVDPKPPRGQWRHRTPELDALELPLPPPRAARSTGAFTPEGAARARGSLGMGTGPAGWVLLRTSAGAAHSPCRFGVGIPAGRLRSVAIRHPSGGLAGSGSKRLPSGGPGRRGQDRHRLQP